MPLETVIVLPTSDAVVIVVSIPAVAPTRNAAAERFPPNVPVPPALIFPPPMPTLVAAVPLPISNAPLVLVVAVVVFEKDEIPFELNVPRTATPFAFTLTPLELP